MKKIVSAVALSAALAALSGVAVAGDAAAGKTLFGASCASCHGMSAEGQGMFPKLAGHAVDDTVAKLKKYKAGEQVGANTAMMAPMAAGLSDADMANVAAYLASLK
jgi:cytochrome c553